LLTLSRVFLPRPWTFDNMEYDEEAEHSAASHFTHCRSLAD
jgi:hypothetical protein